MKPWKEKVLGCYRPEDASVTKLSELTVQYDRTQILALVAQGRDVIAQQCCDGSISSVDAFTAENSKTTEIWDAYAAARDTDINLEKYCKRKVLKYPDSTRTKESCIFTTDNEPLTFSEVLDPFVNRIARTLKDTSSVCESRGFQLCSHSCVTQGGCNTDTHAVYTNIPCSSDYCTSNSIGCPVPPSSLPPPSPPV